MEGPNFFEIILIILVLAGMWRVFQKAGRRGWEGIIPIYNLFVIQRIIGKPWWWVILMLIPFLGLIWQIWSLNLLVKSFGKNEGYTVGMLFLPFIFWPLLGFGKAEYMGIMQSSYEDDFFEKKTATNQENTNNYYKILGVNENATEQDIKEAYRRLVHVYHPDKNDGDDKMFKKINEAYNALIK